MDINITNVSRNVTRAGNPVVRFKVTFLEEGNPDPPVEMDGFMYTTKRNVLVPKGPNMKQYITIRQDILDKLKEFFDNSPDAQLALGPYEEDPRDGKMRLQVGRKL